MGLALIAVIALAGCERLFAVSGLPIDSGDDGHRDVSPLEPDGPPGCITVGMNGSGQGTLAAHGFYQRCLLDSGKQLTLTGPLSTNGSMCDSTTIDSSVCAVVASEIDIEGPVVVTGPLPLVLVATRVINVSGSLSLSSSPSSTGAGADWAACDTLPLAGSANGGGGAGGTLDPSFPGGYGGASQNAGVPPRSPTTPYVSLHGGCQGGTDSSAALSPTDSGGAVYLMAPTISVTGAIEANGADGAGGSSGAGGGYGGGSGGMIVLDAATIAPGGGMFRALGGGGGGGGSLNGGGVMGSGGSGGAGGDATAGYGGNGYAMPNQAFSGGNGVLSPQTVPGGGGGGVGGAGGILLFTMEPATGGSFDPPATL